MKKSSKRDATSRYTPFVEWSDEDQCYVGQCPELFFGGVHGDDRTAVYAELCEAVDEMVAILRADGKDLPAPVGNKEFSGKFVLRVDPSLHKLLTLRALGEGDSLNSYCAKKLARA